MEFSKEYNWKEVNILLGGKTIDCTPIKYKEKNHPIHINVEVNNEDYSALLTHLPQPETFPIDNVFTFYFERKGYRFLRNASGEKFKFESSNPFFGKLKKGEQVKMEFSSTHH